MSNRKAMIILLSAGLRKNTSVNKMSYFPEPYNRNKNKIAVELDLSSYPTKNNRKKCNMCLSSKFVRKVDLANIKSNIDKEETTPADLSNLNKIVINEVA